MRSHSIGTLTVSPAVIWTGKFVSSSISRGAKKTSVSFWSWAFCPARYANHSYFAPVSVPSCSHMPES